MFVKEFFFQKYAGLQPKTLPNNELFHNFFKDFP